MKLGRRPSPEETAWRELVALWDANLGELKTKVRRAQQAEDAVDREESDDQRG